VSDTDRIRVAVVFGGRSSEHAISCVTAGSVLSALDPDRFDVVPIGITTEGRWVLSSDRAVLAIQGRELPSVQDSGTSVALSGDPTAVPAALAGVDVVFPLLHGAYGEDGTLQGLLELAGIPYVGSGVFASAAAMDKAHMKRLLAAAGMTVPPYVVVRDGRPVPAGVIDLGLPVFVKPARSGSSIGISRVSRPEELDAALALAHSHDPKALVETAVVGREIECGVLAGLDGGPPEASLPAEVRVAPGAAFYDFEAKYMPESGTEFDIPPATSSSPRTTTSSSTRSTRCPASPRSRCTRRCGQPAASTTYPWSAGCWTTHCAGAPGCADRPQSCQAPRPNRERARPDTSAQGSACLSGAARSTRNADCPWNDVGIVTATLAAGRSAIQVTAFGSACWNHLTPLTMVSSAPATPAGRGTPHRRTTGGLPQACVRGDRGWVGRDDMPSSLAGSAFPRWAQQRRAGWGGWGDGDRARGATRCDPERENRADQAGCPPKRRMPGQRWTTGQVSVLVIPGTPWIFATTSLPSSSTLRASLRTITSYGPVTSSAIVTPLSAAIAVATAAALPTSVWMRM
jgi:D-alanine-D-alanine ligase